MFDKIKNITALKGVSIIGLSDIASSVIGSIFWLYLASLLGAENYGQLSYFLSIASIASTVSLLGTENVISVYIAKKIKLESTIFLIPIIAGSIASIILYLIFSDLGITVYVLGAVIFGLASTEILAKGLFKAYSKYLLVTKITMVILSIGLYNIMGLEGILVGVGLAFFVYLVRIYKGFRETKIDFSLIKPRAGFLVNSFALQIINSFNGSLDKLIIAPLVGFALLGNYHLGIQFLSILHILPGIVYKYVLPQDASGKPNKKLKQLTIISSIAIAILGIILGPIVIPLFLPQYTEAIVIIQIMSVSVIPSTINLMYTSKLLGNEKIKYLSIGSGIYLIALILGIIILGLTYGINGIATAIIISTSAETCFYYFINKTKMKDQTVKK
jgi:O-antigen/teichoic acid export membrane protein